MIGDSLREHPENLMNNFNQDTLKARLMTGPYATIHVNIFKNYYLLEFHVHKK